LGRSRQVGQFGWSLPESNLQEKIGSGSDPQKTPGSATLDARK